MLNRFNTPMARNIRIALVFTALVLTLMFAGYRSSVVGADNGFDLSGALIPVNEILHGGPGRDGIPSIDEPRFIAAADAAFLAPDDPVLGLSIAGETRAYPIRILNWHEIVNDRIDGRAIVVSYCPLCGTGTVFSAEFDGAESRFGVSGLLYNSDLLLYDEQTESLWSQIMGQAISGPLKGHELALLPVNHTTWAAWSKQHPETQVLSTDTGYSRDYDRSPYGDYDIDRARFFPVSHESRRFHPKERVIGLEIEGQYKAYAFEQLPDGEGRITDRFAGQQITLEFNTPARSGTVYAADGRVIPTINSFWFAWYGFHPDTAIYERKPGQQPDNSNPTPSRIRGSGGGDTGYTARP